MALNITRGVVPKAQKVVVYGPEGIGKTTLAAQFPDPLFVDVEGGSSHMDVARAEAPRSWAALLSTVDAVRAERPCATLVVDTADWAERLCAESICAKRKWDSIETPGYGKGYTELAEEFGRLLDKLTEVAEAGVNVVLAAHAAMRKFEQPDEAAPYDRWELKLQKKVAPTAEPETPAIAGKLPPQWDRVAQLCAADGYTCGEVMAASVMLGNFTPETPAESYPADYLDGCVAANWEKFKQHMDKVRAEEPVPF